MDIAQGLSFIQDMAVGELLILLGLGVAILLFGYRIKKIAFFIAWFILGYLLMEYFLPQINNMVPDIRDNMIYQTLLPFGGGAIMALLGFSIEKLCVGGICFALTIFITVTNFGSEMNTLIIGAIIGVLLAGFAVMMMKPATIVATAVLGAYAITLALVALITAVDLRSYNLLMLAGLAAVGGVFQFLTTKRIS